MEMGLLKSKKRTATMPRNRAAEMATRNVHQRTAREIRKLTCGRVMLAATGVFSLQFTPLMVGSWHDIAGYPAMPRSHPALPTRAS